MRRSADASSDSGATDGGRSYDRFRSGALAGTAALSVLLAGTVPPGAGAGEEHVLRFATMAPKSRRLAVEAGRWQERVSRATGGRVKVVVYWGGGSGDEKAIVRKMRMGQFDAAALSTIALSAYIKQVQVLNAPLTIESYAQLDAVLEEVSADFDREAYANGMKLLGWGDIGKLRMFSKKPVRSLGDLRRTRPWLYKEVLMGKEFFDESVELIAGGEQPMWRIIPRWKSIKDVPGVLPFEDPREILKSQEILALVHCPCKREHRQRECGIPDEVCINVGRTAQYNINRGAGKQITAEEALRICDGENPLWSKKPPSSCPMTAYTRKGLTSSR